ncbi:DUF418 domain-containing protein [Sphingorhabdus sp. 109]|jgi:uncharacterized protein|uniref:DUF418 domain-containing protein n=1 Tax=Sphingorhabdus sp. 109 TaxID=2653173 RepID=UPI0012F0DEDF|nr:DUF418 domain-containing protein [Sphingorhabdus sp. 109]VWX61513.1 conserved membrane hypothetical protein [Sphingorhabdus sp. 109]
MSASYRFVEIDALRGFAVMGILAINIAAFAQPEMAFVNPLLSSHASNLDIAGWAANFILFDGKMRGLFSLLFGASSAMVIERAVAGGQSAAEVHFSRMFWLALFGLVHFFLLWMGDILFLYAGCGCILYLFRNWDAERLVKWGVIAYAVGAILLITDLAPLLLLAQEAAQANPPQDVLDRIAEIYTVMGTSPAEIAAETARISGGFATLLQYKIFHQWSVPLENLMLGPIETIPLMMIGMGLYKNGFILGQENPATYRKIGVAMMAVGLPVFVALAAIAHHQNFNTLWMLNITQAWSALPRLLMIIGYAALLIHLVQRFRDSLFVQRVAATGRAAFSNYLGTSIVMTFIFYGWGLGYFEQFGRFELQLFVVGAWLVMLLWSRPWLSRYRYGPLEWLWRSLARQRAQPMRLS